MPIAWPAVLKGIEGACVCPGSCSNRGEEDAALQGFLAALMKNKKTSSGRSSDKMLSIGKRIHGVRFPVKVLVAEMKDFKRQIGDAIELTYARLRITLQACRYVRRDESTDFDELSPSGLIL